MDTKGVERFILKNWAKKPDKSVRGALLFNAVAYYLLALLCVGGFLIFAAQEFMINALALLLLMLLLSISWTIIFSRVQIARLAEMTDEEFDRKGAPTKRTAITVIAGIISGVILDNIISRIDLESDSIMPVLIFVFGGLVAPTIANISVYKLSLLNKYCPYLSALEDRLYDN